jgi:hypothetical protein
MKLFQNPIWFLLVCAMFGCKEEYYSEVKPTEQSVIVVEGILNSGDGQSNIKLTRTVKLYDSVTLRPELAAVLVVEGKDGVLFSLIDSAGDGNYSAANHPLNSAETYRLRIITRDGKEYVTDTITVLTNPPIEPIDSISWKRDEKGVTIFANTHNPQNNTLYYRWEYNETWEIRSRYFAYPPPEDGIMDTLYLGENIYNCWKFFNSTNIILGNTTQLASDVVSEKELTKIIDGDDRLSERYSVLVRQYALDKKGYDFYQLMKKNTESLGSIFDPQPTEITGNVHAVSNASTPVIGYVTATSVDSMRLWISTTEVPLWKPWMDCSQHLMLNSHTDDISAYTAGHAWLIYASDMSGNVYLAPAPCVSCRIRGGATHKPAFW